MEARWFLRGNAVATEPLRERAGEGGAALAALLVGGPVGARVEGQLLLTPFTLGHGKLIRRLACLGGVAAGWAGGLNA